MSLLIGLGLVFLLIPMNYMFFLMMKKIKPSLSIGIAMMMFGVGMFISGLYVITILMTIDIDKPLFFLGLTISILVNLFFKIIYVIKTI